MLSIFLVFFLFPTAKAATYISNCTNITESGYYILSNDIYATTPAFGSACIYINASDVTLNLNWHGIYKNHSSVHYGILVQCYSPTPCTLNNIVILNGKVHNFTYDEDIGIYMIQTAYSAINSIDFFYDWHGIRLFNWCDHVTIFNNTFYALPDGDAIRIEGGANIFIDKNTITYGERGIYINSGWGNTINYNTIGRINFTECCECYTEMYYNPFTLTFVEVEHCSCRYPCDYIGPEYGILMEGTYFNNSIINNYVYSPHRDVVLTGEGYQNVIAHNTFISDPHTYNGIFLMNETHDNYGCDNEGYVIDYGTNNTFEDACPGPPPAFPCIPHYICTDSYSAWVSESCDITNYTYCPYGCNATTGQCNPAPPGAPPTPPTVPTETITIVNATEWTEMGYGWLLPLLTPMFLLTFIALMVSGIIALASRPEFGGIALLVFLILYTLYGIYPSWIGWTVIIIAGFVVTYAIGKQMGWIRS